MVQNILHRLPPPPLFTIRPPPTPPGSLLKHYHAVEISNGQCTRPSLNILNNSTPNKRHEESISWSNLFLFLLAIISVIFCIIIAIFIIICLRKLRKEERQYKDYVMTGSLLSRNILRHQTNVCAKNSEHNEYGTNTFNCCDDLYSHQLLTRTGTPRKSLLARQQTIKSTTDTDYPPVLNNVDNAESSQNHQYECIPEYCVTVNGHRHSSNQCYQQSQMYHQPNLCSIPPYATFSQSFRLSQGLTTPHISNSSHCTCSPPSSSATVQEESLTPLLASSIYKESHHQEELLGSVPESMIMAWTKQKLSTIHTDQLRYSFVSQTRKSALLQ